MRLAVVVVLLNLSFAASVFAQQAPLDEAAALNRQAIQLYQQGRYTEAEPLARRMVTIYETSFGPEHPTVAGSLQGLAVLYAAQGRYAQAEPLYRRSLAIYEKALGPEHLDVATALNHLALIYLSQGRYAEAEALYRRSLTILEKLLGPEHADVATSLQALAELYRMQGRYAEAGPLHRRSLAIYEKALGPEQYPHVAAALNNFALLYVAQGRYAEAEPLHRRSLAIKEKALGPGDPSLAVSLNNLAGLYKAQGRHAEAEPLYKRSLAIMEKALGPEHVHVGTFLNDLAVLYVVQGRYVEAEPLHRRSLAIKEKALGPEHPSVAVSLESIAFMAQRRSQIDDAIATMRRAVAIREKRALESTGPDGSGGEAERLNVRHSFVRFLSIAEAYAGKSSDREAAVARESFPVAQLAGQSSADRALAQAAARFASGNDALARVVRERQDGVGRRDLLDKAILTAASRPPDKRDANQEQAMRDEFLAVDRNLNQIDAQLRRDFPEFAELSQPRPLSLAEAQKLLAPDEALVAFVIADEASYRFILRRDKAEFRRIGIKRADLDGQVKALREGLDPRGVGKLSDLPRFDAGMAHGLYKTLFVDAAPLIAGAKRLLIVPDGSLGGLPFSVLPTKPPAAGAQGFATYRRVDWLVRDYAIAVLPSVGSLRALRVFAARAQAPREPFLGFGDPNLQGRPGDARGIALKQLASRAFLADPSIVRQLPSLPDTAGELQKIAVALRADPASAIKLRADATERNVKTTDLSQYRVLAFATHGLMAGEFAGYGEPALVLTPPARGSEIDDGLLGASEVAGLRLNADWVILSACNTAAPDGAPGAEGLSGLARSFFYAGTRALLVSHWPVLSDASVRLTTGAIETLARDPHIGRAEAVRRAMLSLLDDPTVPTEYAHPAIWAPFSLVGEGAPGR